MYKVVKIDYDINLTEVSDLDTFDEAKKKHIEVDLQKLSDSFEICIRKYAKTKC